MLLAIDIGNTNITLGIWDSKMWRREWRLQTDSERTVDEFGILLTSLLREAQLENAIDGVILASVVPSLSATFLLLCKQYLHLEPILVSSQIDSGIQIRTDNPAEVGADRIVNAAAAYHLFHAPCIVIDMGTAITFDVISARAELLGVVIAPGIKLAADALINRAAQLSHVSLQAPPRVTGRNTIHAIQSGLIFGYVSLIEGMVERLIAEHPNTEEKIQVIGTGGLINLVSPHTDIIDHVDPWLTLTGLRVIYERANR